MEITHLLSLSVFILLSIQTVNCLQCYTCNDAKCEMSKPVTCPEISRAECQSISFKMGDVNRVLKGCSQRDLCNVKPPIVPPGVEFKTHCCDTDLCNSAITTKMSLLLAGFLVLMSLCVSRF
ncbi:lymphocyte antigen 6C1-like isoform X1 [Bufo bufo]|uniref:lymphocyte antigen 6C1-like isoform X1 n=1 Tax=Bufo bufo TaxID=8384 RepID=UPI001ABE02C2|nr:lymphocyte antigen 6C1-like isoform X1 [Bufo bufo]